MPGKPARPKSIRANKKLLARSRAAGPLARRSKQVEHRGAPPWETGAPGAPALPGGDCLTPPHPDWLPSEKWAWSKICRGEPADFNKRYGNIPGPRKEEDWEGLEGERRKIRPEFVRMVLLHEPWRSAVTSEGVIIMGSLVQGEVKLDSSRPNKMIRMFNCRLHGAWNFRDVESPHLTAFIYCCFTGDIVLERSVIAGGVFVRDCCLQGEARLAGMLLKGQLEIINSEIKRDLIADNVIISGNLCTKGSVFNGRFALPGSRIKGQLDIQDTLFNDKVILENAELADVFARGSSFKQGANFCSCKVFGDICLEGIWASGVIEFRDVRLGSVYLGWRTCHQKHQDKREMRDSVLAALTLDGFKYDHFVFCTAKGKQRPFATVEMEQLLSFLARQREFSPQALRAHGRFAAQSWPAGQGQRGALCGQGA